MLPRLVPHVAVLRRQGPDGGRLGRLLVDAPKLRLQLRGVQLLPADLVRDRKKLVLADHHDVLVLPVVVLDGVVALVGGHAAGVEHPFVRLHADGHVLHVLRLERAGVDLLLELEHGRGEGGGALGRVAARAVVAVRVEVADVRHHGVARAEVRQLVPPRRQPVARARVVAPRQQPPLQLAAQPAGPRQVLDGRARRAVLVVAQQRPHRVQVTRRRLLERGHGQPRQRVLEAEHGADIRIFPVACAVPGARLAESRVPERGAVPSGREDFALREVTGAILGSYACSSAGNLTQEWGIVGFRTVARSKLVGFTCKGVLRK